MDIENFIKEVFLLKIKISSNQMIINLFFAQISIYRNI